MEICESMVSEKGVFHTSKIASQSEIFNISGPLHLTAIDWNNTHHRRSIAASLVQGVYILERDRQQQREGSQAFAPPWWDFFKFQLIHLLVDDADRSIFGAIFEYKCPASRFIYPAQKPPTYVIAFRGTITRPDTRSQDLKLDLRCILNTLQHSPRFQHAMNAVQNMVASAGAKNVWLAGHSLGSAIALLVGRNMVKSGCPLETYLFNQPFTSAPTERIKNEKLKHGARIAGSIITAGLAIAVNGIHQKTDKNDTFAVLSGWIPYLYVNPSDHICSAYVGYFEHRDRMLEVGAGEIQRLATQNSIGTLIAGALGKDSEPMHLLPSAFLTINLSPSPDFRQAHGLEQWWKPDFYCQSKLHMFR